MKSLLAQILVELIKIRSNMEFWRANKGGGSWDANMGHYRDRLDIDINRIEDLELTYVQREEKS